MLKRVTFSTNYTSTIDYYKRVSDVSGRSLSSILSEELHRASQSHAKKTIPMITDKSSKKKAIWNFTRKFGERVF
ncbi:hypothetical protein CH64_1535 [Yersinia rohdei]|uniref:Uncharacterized protein n=1 Tax=Yersinia rohdei TaxID=29485 RepID=A0ABN4F4R2_YERRO|nr:hypothetical protein CH64_1535 [Yersinia rohdei]